MTLITPIKTSEWQVSQVRVKIWDKKISLRYPLVSDVLQCFRKLYDTLYTVSDTLGTVVHLTNEL